MYLVGRGKADITAYKKGGGMLGYAMFFHTMEGIETPLYARAFVIADPNANTKQVFVNCELAFITNTLKAGVLSELAKRNLDYNDATLMLTAQHTHSGPGGYAYYGMYNITVPGFAEDVYWKIINGIVEAIEMAEKNLQPANISFAKGEFELDRNVAFIRSMKQYNQNPEVSEKLNPETLNKGVNREMYLLKFTDEAGKEIGSINWFGVHTTSVSNDLNKVCSDNKGYASDFYEKDKGDDVVAVFAQGTCGDVSPRFKYNPKRKYQRGYWEGEFQDDYKSAKYNGKLQFEKAKEIAAKEGEVLTGALTSALLYTDFSQIACDPEFTNGNLDARTVPAAMGTAFLGGARMDGPGMPLAGEKIANFMLDCVKLFEKTKAFFVRGEYKEAIDLKYKMQGPKHVVLETHARRVMGTGRIHKLIFPSWAEPTVALLKTFYKKEGYKNKPWTPQVLPLQIWAIGQVALCAFPFEITTISGKRLKKSLENRLREYGITEVILVPYANDFSGYITTNEEYQVQMYEGGHTVFGQWSLAGLQTKFDELAKNLNKQTTSSEVITEHQPPVVTLEELREYPFFVSDWYRKTHKNEVVEKNEQTFA